jgi:DNA-directed RNA polymerase specialized sigma24 family protein
VADLLRVFLRGLVTARPPPVPEDLLRLARGVLGPRAGAADVDDLVGEFLLRLVDATAHRRAGSAEFMLDLDDRRLRGTIRHRLRQMLAETCPGARLRKQLRAFVKVLLSEDRLPVPAAPPTSLYRGDRLSSELVREAMAWVLLHEETPRTPAGITARLMAMYCVREASTGATEQGDPEHDLHTRLEVQRLLLGLAQDCSQQARAVHMRLAGLSLQAIAEQQGVSISTAHTRVSAGVTALQARHLGVGTYPTGAPGRPPNEKAQPVT